MKIEVDYEKGTVTMTTSEFWSGLKDLLAQADAHPIDSRDEDMANSHRDRDACLVRGQLEDGRSLWPLIKRDIENDPALDTKLRRPTRYETLAAALLTAKPQQRTSTEENTPGWAVCALVVLCSSMMVTAACQIRRCGQ